MTYKSEFHPVPDAIMISLMKYYKLPKEFLENYKECNEDDCFEKPEELLKELKSEEGLFNIGIYDMPNENKGDVIILNELKTQWQSSREALVNNLFIITNFYEKEVLQVYMQTGKETNQAMAFCQGLYYSRALRYAAAKRKDVYKNLIEYGKEHYLNVTEKEWENQLQDMCRVGLHAAMMREEKREQQQEFKEGEESDPFVKMIACCLRQE